MNTKITEVLKDILLWIRKILKWRKTKGIIKPFTEISSTRCKYGLLRKVDRDTPRAVLTYIYTPFPEEVINQTTQKIYDFHICLDHLWALDKEDRVSKSSVKRHNLGTPSHELNIFMIDRFKAPDIDIPIDKMIFSKKYDFVGKNNPYRDRLAIAIISTIVNDLKIRRFKEIDWEFEISVIQRAHMGTHYYETPSQREEREKRKVIDKSSL